MKNPSLLAHLRDIAILPFTMTVIVPYYFIHPHVAAGFIGFKVAGIIFGGAGLFLFLATVMLFWRIGRGTLAPWSPKQKLVVVGPYRYCRNPMITGVFCVLVAEALFFQSTGIAMWALIFFGINSIYFLVYEEPDLEERFGEDYRIYKTNVPRWIPRLKPFRQ